MSRLLVLILVLSTASVLVADAQCGAACSAKRCGPVRSGTSCPHSSKSGNPAPGIPQCLHEHGIAAWLRPATVDLTPDNARLAAALTPVDHFVFERVHAAASRGWAAFEPPETPLRITLRI